MADTQSSQPLDPIFERLEESLEQWRDHLTRVGPTLPPQDFTKLMRSWDDLRQNFEVASLHNGLDIPDLSALMGPLPVLKDFDSDELQVTVEALQNARKTLGTMLSETRSRIGLLEEVLNSDKPQKMRKILEKMRGIDQSLQTRLLGLDAYVEQFRLAELPDYDLLSSTQKIIEQSERLQKMSEENETLDKQAEQMQRWLAESKLNLARMPIAPPPSPGAMQKVSLSLTSSSEADKALVALFSNHEKLKDARLYLENYLAQKEES